MNGWLVWANVSIPALTCRLPFRNGTGTFRRGMVQFITCCIAFGCAAAFLCNPTPKQTTVMKKMMLCAALALSLFMVACEKDEDITDPSNLPRTEVPGHLQGLWMYGNFSTTEYWSTAPSTYIGNAFTIAIAFKFGANGTYEQYFTSSAVTLGVATYHQSVTKGTVEVDEATKTIVTHPYTSHYMRTRGTVVEEDRDMKPSEMDEDTYTYTTETEVNGTKSIVLKIDGNSPLKFLRKD